MVDTKLTVQVSTIRLKMTVGLNVHEADIRFFNEIKQKQISFLYYESRDSRPGHHTDYFNNCTRITPSDFKFEVCQTDSYLLWTYSN